MTSRKPVVVMKFGGTSMGSAEAMTSVMTVVEAARAHSRVAAVVVSAMSGTTDELIKIARTAASRDKSYAKMIVDLKVRHKKAAEALVHGARAEALQTTLDELFSYLKEVITGISLIGEFSSGALDYVMSYGERLSAHILAEALAERGIPSEYLNARSVVRTDDQFGSAAVDFETTNEQLRAHFDAHESVQVTTGFIGSTKDGKTTTLGRGGSDYTASIVGAAIDADVIEIWTDVSGVYTADPRKVQGAFPLERMTYLEAIEMSYFGAKVIHPPTMYPAMQKKIPIVIKNTFAPDAPGTLISAKRSGGIVKGISSIGSVAMVQLTGSGMQGTRGASGRLFGALSRAKVNVILIAQASSQNAISFAIAPLDVEAARAAIEEEFRLERRSKFIDAPEITPDVSVIAVVGEGMHGVPGVAGKIFETLGRNHINAIAIAQGSSEINISCVVAKSDEARALQAIHTACFFPEAKPVHLFLVGAGQIGTELLKQIKAQQELLSREQGFRIRVVGIGDADHMVFDEHGINLASWQEKLAAGESMNLRAYLAHMKEMDLPGKTFVDCTASQEVADVYADVLGWWISVVTPNKRANSGAYAYYQTLAELAKKPGVSFLYETNACAALPVISMLDDLAVSGDTFVKIEGVLSGTLSYIFNTFDGSKPFSEVVREAKECGYTEPDPKQDLSGADVARKILILARKCGLPLELKDIAVETLLGSDASFEKRRKEAEEKGERLRYIATLEDGKATVALKSVPASHPFYNLTGTDNIVSITTARYSQTPLVIKGPGAGAGVTAAGVFADVLRAARDMA